MMASSWALRLMLLVPGSEYRAASNDSDFHLFGTRYSAPFLPRKLLLPPVVANCRLLAHDGGEVRVFAHCDFAEKFLLPDLNRLQANHFEQRQEHAHERLTRWNAQ